jgi:hypothetical protein
MIFKDLTSEDLNYLSKNLDKCSKSKTLLIDMRRFPDTAKEIKIKNSLNTYFIH